MNADEVLNAERSKGQYTNFTLNSGNPHSSTSATLTPEAQVIEAMFFIQSKEGTKLPFILNGDQRRYDSRRSKRDIVPKARQRGVSSYGIALQTVDCLGKEGTRAVLISHEAKATQRLLDKASYYINNLRGATASLGRHSRNEFFFPETHSTFYIGTAGAKAFGRGDTINHLHISEYAWWESDALKQVAGLFQAVPLGGTIRIESTGNGRVNDFYYMVENAEKLGYVIHFLPWWDNDEYHLPLPDGGYTPDGYEDYFETLRSNFPLTNEQVYWYWVKLLEFRGDLRYMQQEYPSKLEECFQSTGGSVFQDINRVHSEYWQYRQEKIEGVKYATRCEYHAEHPQPRRTYVLGADPSGGTGNDEAAVQILCLETMEQVFELGSNTIDPVVFGHYLAKLGKLYNEAYIVCEANSYGIATHSVLKREYSTLKIYKKILPSKSGQVRYGFQTTEESKKLLVGSIKQLLEMGMSLYGIKTLTEMSKFEEDPDTEKLSAPEDGLVIALGLASIGYFKYERYAFKIKEAEIPKPKITHEGVNYMYFTFEDMMERLKRQEQSTVFGSQLESRRGLN